MNIVLVVMAVPRALPRLRRSVPEAALSHRQREPYADDSTAKNSSGTTPSRLKHAHRDDGNNMVGVGSDSAEHVHEVSQLAGIVLGPPYTVWPCAHPDWQRRLLRDAGSAGRPIPLVPG